MIFEVKNPRISVKIFLKAFFFVKLFSVEGPNVGCVKSNCGEKYATTNRWTTNNAQINSLRTSWLYLFWRLKGHTLWYTSCWYLDCPYAYLFNKVVNFPWNCSKSYYGSHNSALHQKFWPHDFLCFDFLRHCVPRCKSFFVVLKSINFLKFV